MDVKFFVKCPAPNCLEIVRVIAEGDASDRFSDSKAISQVTVLRTNGYATAHAICDMLNSADINAKV